jgi:phage pi2 protein 07
LQWNEVKETPIVEGNSDREIAIAIEEYDELNDQEFDPWDQMEDERNKDERETQIDTSMPRKDGVQYAEGVVPLIVESIKED